MKQHERSIKNPYWLTLPILAVVIILSMGRLCAQNHELLFSQPYHDGGEAHTSAIDLPFPLDIEVAENFHIETNSETTIDKVVFYGFTWLFTDGVWQEQVPADSEPFIIRFYEYHEIDGPVFDGRESGKYAHDAFFINDSENLGARGYQMHTDLPNMQKPGEVLVAEPDWDYPVSVQNIMTTVSYVGPAWNNNYQLYRFEAILDEPVDLGQKGWVSVQIDAVNGSGTWFLWLNSLVGDGLAWQRVSQRSSGETQMVNNFHKEAENGERHDESTRGKITRDMSLELWKLSEFDMPVAHFMIPDDIIEQPGTVVNVPVYMDLPDQAFCNIDLYIGFDSNVLTFQGIVDSQLPGNTFANTLPGSDSEILINWFSTQGHTAEGVLLNLEFLYLGGESEITFLPELMEVIDCTPQQTAIPFSVSDGFISQAPPELVVNIPEAVVVEPCAEDLEAQFIAWVEGFSFSGDPDAVDNLDEIPQLPENAYCHGAEIVFEYIVTGTIEVLSGTSTFTVIAPEDLELILPEPVELTSCMSGEAIMTAYAQWAEGFDFTGDCHATDNIETIPALPEDVVCQGVSIVFLYQVSGTCASGSGSSSFVVLQPDPLEFDAPENFFGLTTDYTGQAEVDAAFAAWLTEFSVSGGCDPEGTFVGEPVAPDWAGGSVEVTYAATDLCEDGQVSAIFTILSTQILSGVVEYYKYNAPNLPLSDGVTVSLLNEDGNVLASTQTEAGGFYSFDFSEEEVNLLLETAFVEVSAAIPHGGIRGADALAVQNRAIIIFAPFWTPVNFVDLVANVIYTFGSGPGEFPDIIDAANIQQRFVFPESFESFEAGNWAFFAPELSEVGVVFDNLPGGPQAGRIAYNPLITELNILARTFGDVRGDYVPLAVDRTLQPIHTDEVTVVGINEMFTLPVTTLYDMTFSAMSLDLYYNTSKIEVLGLHTGIPGVLYSINDGNIRVVFADAFTQQMLQKGDAVITLDARTIASVSPGDILFSSSDDTEFSDELAMPLSFFGIGVSRLDNMALDVPDVSDTGIAINAYPNPFRDVLNLGYVISAPAIVRISIVNTMGEHVAEVVNERHDAGRHQLVISPERLGLLPGVYSVSMQVEGRGFTGNRMIRVLYVR